MPDYYGILGIRGIQSSESDKPLLVGCVQEDYIPDSLPDEIKHDALWVQLEQAMQEGLDDLEYKNKQWFFKKRSITYSRDNDCK